LLGKIIEFALGLISIDKVLEGNASTIALLSGTAIEFACDAALDTLTATVAVVVAAIGCSAVGDAAGGLVDKAIGVE
jgi:hypothetical protein